MSTFTGYSLVFIPASWQLGVWRKMKGCRVHKLILSLGPFRFVKHYSLGAWKPAADFEPAINKGTWLKGPSPSERVGLTDTRAGDCMEPIDYKRRT